MENYDLFYSNGKMIRDIVGELPIENQIYEIFEGDDLKGFRVSEVRHRLVKETKSLTYEVRLSPLK